MKTCISSGYNNNTIRVQRAVSCQSGNTRGRKDHDKSWVNVFNDPVAKRKKEIGIQTATVSQDCRKPYVIIVQVFTSIEGNNAFIHCCK